MVAEGAVDGNLLTIEAKSKDCREQRSNIFPEKLPIQTVLLLVLEISQAGWRVLFVKNTAAGVSNCWASNGDRADTTVPGSLRLPELRANIRNTDELEVLEIIVSGTRESALTADEARTI